jgi:hypothetical protein
MSCRGKKGEKMKKIAIALAAAAAAVGIAFEAGRALGPRAALAQQAGQGAPNRLPQPYDVVAHMQKEQRAWDISASGVQTWDNETVGGLTFLRLSVASGKIWYVPLEHVTWIEATPILAPQAPAPPMAPPGPR